MGCLRGGGGYRLPSDARVPSEGLGVRGVQQDADVLLSRLLGSPQFRTAPLHPGSVSRLPSEWLSQTTGRQGQGVPTAEVPAPLRVKVTWELHAKGRFVLNDSRSWPGHPLAWAAGKYFLSRQEGGCGRPRPCRLPIGQAPPLAQPPRDRRTPGAEGARRQACNPPGCA